MEIEKNKYCSVTVYPKDTWGSFHGHHCNKKPTVEREGKSYCSTHDPEAVKKRDIEQRKKWDRESKAKQELWSREAFIKNLFKDIPTSDLENWEMRRREGK